MRKYYKGMSALIVLVFILGIVFSRTTFIAFGSNNQSYIEAEAIGTGRTGNTMFDQGYWGPGSQQEGILRLRNNYQHRVKVTNLALSMVLHKLVNNEYVLVDDADIYVKYAESMMLTVKRGHLPLFREEIFKDSFYNMLYQSGSFKYEGYTIPSHQQFNVHSNATVDLSYTISMKPEAGNELQGLKATVDFIINLRENPIPAGEDDDSGSEAGPAEGEPELAEDDHTPLGQHWAHDCIARLIKEGIVLGYPDGSIQADNPITRAETAAIIARALKLESRRAFATGYLDPVPGWARGAVIAVTEAGIFRGYPVLLGKVFRGNSKITREEMAAVLMRGFKPEPADGGELGFVDKADISPWSSGYIRTGVQNGIITGYPDNSFRPKDYITRGEAFAMICRLLGYHTEHQ